jgi:arginine exporter protein ArgO
MAPTWPSKLACTFGAAVGIFVWFVILSYGASLGRGRLSEASLVRVERWSGIVLLLFALFLGIRLIALLADRPVL